MRVVVTGATSPVGASVVEALRHDPDKRVDTVVALARDLPTDRQPDVDWRSADMEADDMGLDDLVTHFQGADAVVHGGTTSSRGRGGSGRRGGSGDAEATIRRVLGAAARAGVTRTVAISSFAVYSPAGPGHDPVDESWPTEGVADAPAAREALGLERAVREYAGEHEAASAVILRAGIALGPRSRAQFLARLGPLGARLPQLARLPFLPGISGAALPAVHHDDLASACRAAVTRPATGAYNVALDTPLALAAVAETLGARPVGVPVELAERGVELAGRLLDTVRGGTQATLGGWLALASRAPRLDCSHARAELGWTPVHSLDEALRSTVSGLA